MEYPLLSNRLSISPLGFEDLDVFVSYRQDPGIAKYQSWDPTYSRAQAMELLESQVGVLIPERDDWLQLGIHELISGELVGDLALHALGQDHSAFELGFTIASKHQRKGYAREAAGRLLDYLFKDLGTKSVIAQTDSRNIGSIRTLTSLGFVKSQTKGWDEDFKNELVPVYFFELIK